MCRWGQAPPSKTPPLSGTFGAPPHPTKSAPPGTPRGARRVEPRDFAGTPGPAHRFASGCDVRDLGKTDSHTRAAPLPAATLEIV